MLMCSFTGEYKVILQLVSVLSHGKLAKRLTDRAIDQMQDVQNLRKAIYEYVSFHALMRYHRVLLKAGTWHVQLQAEGASMRQGKREATQADGRWCELLVSVTCVINWMIAKVSGRLRCLDRYRYGTLIVFANYLIEMREGATEEVSFPAWLEERREITMLLGRKSLD